MGSNKNNWQLVIMKAFLRISEAARYLSACTKTIRWWDAAGKLSCFRTPGGHRRIAIVEIQRLQGENMPESLVKETTIYSRVSSHEQKKKGDLARQIEIAKEYCQQKGHENVVVFQDVGSGLNTNR
ncbi:MAG: IS607 family transposase [Candidatus Hodarchaeales archaeon]